MSEELHAKGLHKHRLDDKCDNPREQAFVRQWHKVEQWGILNCLFQVPCEKDDSERLPIDPIGSAIGTWSKEPIGPPTERDRIVAETVVQWLGSNVGLSFLREALKDCGYVLHKRW